MTAYQNGFMRKCAERGVNPQAAARFATEYARGKAAARQYCEKRAEEFVAAVGKLPYYQRGFVMKCAQRGVNPAVVAKFCIDSVKR